jgi:hypothetical protein
MLLLAEGLFRLDVVPSGDTLRVVVRNLAGGPLDLQTEGDRVSSLVFEGAEIYQPASTGVRFTVSGRAVAVTLAAITLPDQGTVRITGQAIVEGRG